MPEINKQSNRITDLSSGNSGNNSKHMKFEEFLELLDEPEDIKSKIREVYVNARWDAYTA